MKRFFPLLFLSLAIAIFCGASSCGDDPPPKPEPPTAKPDTTSHEFEFTLFEVSEMNSSFRDVFALSPDFAIAVGEITDVTGGSNYPTNSYLWDGVNLKQHSLPINPYDTNRISLKRYYSEINNIWAFRRDNMWYSSTNASYAHLTILNGDTNIFNENSVTRSEISDGLGGRIWANDSSEIYFGRKSFFKYKNGAWTQIPTEFYDGDVRDLWGSISNDIFISSFSTTKFKNTFYHYDGNECKLLWKEGYPSLSDSVLFGAPLCFWGFSEDDSVWISGLYLGKMKKDGTGRIRAIKNVNPYGFKRIRGSKKNNVFFVGNDGAISHFNGATIKDYDLYRGKNIRFLSVAVLADEVFIVGDRYFGGAIFVHGKRKK